MSRTLLRNAKPFNVPLALSQAIELHQRGRLAEAGQLYEAILAIRPDHFDALHNLGLIKLATGQFSEALRLVAGAMRLKPPSPQILMNHGLVLNALSRNEEALESFDQAIKLKSKFHEAYNNRGVVLATLGRIEEAMASYRKALAIKPQFADALFNHGNALMQFKRFDEALACYDRVLMLRPDYAEAHYNRGNVLKDLRRLNDALASYDRAIALRPNFAEAHCNRGVALLDMNRLDEALASSDRALAARPNYADALYNRGHILENLKRFDEALASYDLALAARPDLAEAASNRGNALRELKQFDEALASYDRALALRPDMVAAHSNRGMILHELKRLDEALASYDRALGLMPDHIDALNNRGETLQELKRFDEALESYDRLLTLNADHAHAFSGVAACAIKLCDWDRCARLAEDLNERVSVKKSLVSPFVLLGYSGDPALQLQCAKNYVENKFPSPPPPMHTGQTWRHDRPRIAYISADFRTHATAFLMAELFEQHDHSRFDIIGVSLGFDDRSEVRKRLVAGFDHFHDVQQKSDIEVARFLRDMRVDIAVDLKGYTQDSRFGIFAHRPAPIQVNYLGYPNTMGTQLIDYVIADKVIAPFEHQPFYMEKIVHLPDSYQVNDTQRPIAEDTPTRREVGLPERGFVFCSFNNNWKIAPAIFDVWMRLLHQVEGGVLWLLADNDGAERNLREEARRRGIDPSRLVFAGRLAPTRHLARHRLADLFLDTLPCNAHTTASDALWAGLPLLTCTGEAFAGRVAASLLRAAGIPELVTANMDEYHALALKLARDPAMLADIKAKLARNRNSCPLFNTPRFARHIESAYMTMWETWQRGETPRSFSVEPIA